MAWPGSNVVPLQRPRARPASSHTAGDLRFRTLIGEQGWTRLPQPVRARFGKLLTGGRSIIYAGEVVECRMSRCGWVLAQLARLIGAPLPLSRDVFLPAAVSVTEDPASGGQLWTRIYGRRRGFPQVIHSSKRFAGPTGLEEYIGRGFGIALGVAVENEALHFLSDHYFLAVGRFRLRLPGWLSPGRMRVSHIDCNHGCFAFMLSLDHPVLGELVRQTALFHERTRPGEEDRT
ncbi:MAG TPA: DUF4166 domain-containing protein [Allosphingosinicella sp.]|nr:DUF4166 domain-containing protein [Allosphingosinicella sp.]